MLVRMTHPALGERLFSERAVGRLETKGWEVVEPEPETEQDEASEDDTSEETESE